MISEVYILGRGLAGTATAAILAQAGLRVTIVGPEWVRPGGPSYLWSTPSTHTYLKNTLGIQDPRVRLVKVGYWEGWWVQRPSGQHIKTYTQVTGRVESVPSMTEGRSSILVHQVPTSALQAMADDLVRRSPNCRVINKRVRSIETDHGCVVSIDEDIPIRDRAAVVVAIPLPIFSRLVGVDPIVEYSPVAFGTVDRRDLGFWWTESFDYAYTYCPSWAPFYRVTNNRDGTFGVEFDPSHAEWVERVGATVAAVQTPGRLVPIQGTFPNTIQVGRMARGDRSRLSDTIEQAQKLITVEGDLW